MLFKTKKMINAGIIGGAGYGGTELIKLLLFHPKTNLCFVTSRKYAGVKISSVHRFLSGATELKFIEPEVEKFPSDTEVVFLATPHGISMRIIPKLINLLPRARIIDLSGDFRLKNPHIYRQYYGAEHTAVNLLSSFVYGFPELNREQIKNARYIANPGCFATGIIFALYPLYKERLVRGGVTVVAVTGSSGSGEVPKEVTHHPVRSKNFKAYKILEHQHLPEIKQFLEEKSGEKDIEIGFVPQSGPFVRGIFSTASFYNDSLKEEVVKDAFQSHYGKEKFIRLVTDSPEVAMVYASNFVEVSCVYKKSFVVSMSAIDNLVRGASGQAVQNMNIMFGFDEDEGLCYPGIKP